MEELNDDRGGEATTRMCSGCVKEVDSTLLFNSAGSSVVVGIMLAVSVLCVVLIGVTLESISNPAGSRPATADSTYSSVESSYTKSPCVCCSVTVTPASGMIIDASGVAVNRLNDLCSPSEVSAAKSSLLCSEDSSQLARSIVGELEPHIKFSSTEEVSEHSQEESVDEGEYFLDSNENVESESTWGGLIMKESSSSVGFGLEGASIGRTEAEP